MCFKKNTFAGHCAGGNEQDQLQTNRREARQGITENAELSQEVLSERCGIFRTYLSRIESGAANPTLLVLVALADSLGVPPSELLTKD